jgi:hypothetical protein
VTQTKAINCWAGRPLRRVSPDGKLVAASLIQQRHQGAEIATSGLNWGRTPPPTEGFSLGIGLLSVLFSSTGDPAITDLTEMYP